MAASSEGVETTMPRTEVANKSLLAFVRDESSSHRDFYTSHVSDMSHLQQKQDHLLTLFRVPFKVEKLMFHGYWICLDAFLSFYSLIPLRSFLGILTLLRAPITKRYPHAGTLFDLMRLAIFVSVSAVLFLLDTSMWYHFIRGQQTIKLFVVYNVLEIFDKLCCSFGQDIFESLLWSAGSVAAGDLEPASPPSSRPRSRLMAPLRLLAHFIIALCYSMIHAFVLFCQVITLNVAINGYSSTLFALMVSNNFVELKGSVFKKFTQENLFQITCSDIIERFQISVFLLLIVVHNASDSTWNFTLSWASEILGACVLVFASEILVDWIKHGFVSKFNNFSFRVYDKFLRILRADLIVFDADAGIASASAMQSSHIVTRRLGFVALPLASLVARIILPLFPIVSLVNVLQCCVLVLCIAALKLLIRLNLVARVLGDLDGCLAELRAFAATSASKSYQPAPASTSGSPPTAGAVAAAAPAVRAEYK